MKAWLLYTWDKIKEFNSISFLPKDYTTNKSLFRFALFLVASFLVFCAYTMPEDRAYFSCEYVEGSFRMPCDNPFYLVEPCPFVDEGVCQIKEVEPGFSFGTKPKWWFDNAFLISFLIMFLAIGLNHLLYNKRYGWS